MKAVNKNNRLKLVFRRRVFVIVLLIVQIAIIALVIAGTKKYFNYSYIILYVLSIFVCIHVLNKHEKAGYKLTWIFLILLFPVFGGIMYVLFYIWSNQKMLKNLLARNIKDSRDSFYLYGNKLYEFIEAYPYFKTHAHYLQEKAGFPLYSNTRQLYLNSGMAFFQKVLQELEKAKSYIFMEFFILREGAMLNPILEILERKAAEGLDVRVMYDDLGCFLTLPTDFRGKLSRRGIKTFVFNPFRPIVSSLQNNRDHRKIISIDGKIAFTGGLNLADEYINAFERFGHWKDSAVMLEGDGAWSLTLIFLQMWNLGQSEKDDYASFFPGNTEFYDKSCGYVQPYADNPIDGENVGEHVYMQIIYQAKKYVYINTPYLIIDDNLMSALTLAAKSGVDVRIITPHRWDKWYVAIISRSYYRRLIQAGVKVYEYTSGFNHGKTFVADDIIATVGTTNLDFRSLYLHFECGVVLYSSDEILKIKEDFLRTVPISQEVTLAQCAKNAFQRIVPDVLRILAPLM